MSRGESLVLALDTAKLELERLKPENARLHGQTAETAGASSNGQQELHGEVSQL